MIPTKNVQWYVAELVQKINIEGQQSVVHINTVLVEANSPEQAHKRAIELGQRSETAYQNTDSKLVTLIFQGLRDLNVIVEGLTHGAELGLEKKVGLTQAQIEQMIPPKEELGVFRASHPTKGPNYIPKDIVGLPEKSFEQPLFMDSLPGTKSLTKQGVARKRKDVNHWEGVDYCYEQRPQAKPGKATQPRTIQENRDIERKRKRNQDLANFNDQGGNIVNPDEAKA